VLFHGLGPSEGDIDTRASGLRGLGRFPDVHRDLEAAIARREGLSWDHVGQSIRPGIAKVSRLEHSTGNPCKTKDPIGEASLGFRVQCSFAGTLFFFFNVLLQQNSRCQMGMQVPGPVNQRYRFVLRVSAEPGRVTGSPPRGSAKSSGGQLADEPLSPRPIRRLAEEAANATKPSNPPKAFAFGAEWFPGYFRQVTGAIGLVRWLGRTTALSRRGNGRALERP
jgi:hypothetical protein